MGPQSHESDKQKFELESDMFDLLIVKTPRLLLSPTPSKFR